MVSINLGALQKITVQMVQPNKITPVDDPEKQHCLSAIKASLQYCFWFGDSSFRPVDARWVNTKVDEVFKDTKIEDIHDKLDALKEEMINSEITLLKERIESIDEMKEIDYPLYGALYQDSKASIDVLLHLPGFKKDHLKKKALFAILDSNTFSGVSCTFEVPADYRIPQVLVHLGVLEYSTDLQRIIEQDEIIPENSKIEIQIRESSIDACNQIAKNCGCTPFDVDSYLFQMKDRCTNKHHLTVTTNY